MRLWVHYLQRWGSVCVESEFILREQRFYDSKRELGERSNNGFFKESNHPVEDLEDTEWLR